jgi:methionine-S-sulfoxide reductase
VVRTRVGYTGGSTANPTYYNLGDHTESFQVDFDPKQISYEQLLDMFWATDNHCAQAWSRQYMSAVFYADEAQKDLALKTRDRTAAKLGQRVTTEVLPLGTFYLAENYHQKYRLRCQRAFMNEFRAMYPNEADFVNSTAAARVNGVLGGNGTPQLLGQEIDGYGLSPDLAGRLHEYVSRRR